jgi:hypothetical protein
MKPPISIAPVRWILFLLAGAGLALLAWTMWMALAAGAYRPAAAIGNAPRSLAALPAKGPADAIRFAVLSDIEEGVETFREALRLLAERRLDFAVINGDLCYRPTEEGFRYFLWQFRDAPFAGPYFCGAGNHDLVGRRDPALFRKYIGDDRFAFYLGPCQFLIVNNCVGGLSEADFQWLQSAAAEPSPGPEIRHRFLFLHYPPLVTPKKLDVVLPDPACRRLYELAPRLAIRRVFCGNLHAYRRIEIGGVAYVVCGGGGADLQSRGAFHHFIDVTVEAGAVREEIVRLPALRGPIEAMDRFAYLYVGPWMRRHPVMTGLLILLSLAAVAWQVLRLVHWRRGERRLPDPPRAEPTQPPTATG